MKRTGDTVKRTTDITKRTVEIVRRTTLTALIALMISSLMLPVPVKVHAADKAIDISSCSIKLGYTRFIVDGDLHAPKVTVKYKGTRLRKYEDYVLTFENGIRAGRSAAVIRGIGSFRGTAVRYYTGEIRKTSPEVSKQAGASNDPGASKSSGASKSTGASRDSGASKSSGASKDSLVATKKSTSANRNDSTDPGASKVSGNTKNAGASKQQGSVKAVSGGSKTPDSKGASGKSSSSSSSASSGSKKGSASDKKAKTGSDAKKGEASAEKTRNIGSVLSEQKDTRKEADLGTVIKSPEYKACCGMIAEACIGEKGRKRGCVRGDQSGREVKRSKYVYRKGSHSRGWRFIVRARDPEKADLIAAYSRQICSNDNIGYSQRPKGGRSSLYRSGKANNYRFDRISKKVDTSCTPLALACMRAAGIKYINTSKDAGGLKREIRRVNRAYKNAGKKAPFSIITLNSSQYRKYKSNIKRGDVLCTGSHTAVAL